MVTNVKPKVTVTYCSSCGYKLNALTMKKDLLSAFGDQVDIDMVIKGASMGDFEIMLDDITLHSKLNGDGWPRNSKIIQHIKYTKNLSIPFLWRSIEEPPLIHWPSVGVILCLIIGVYSMFYPEILSPIVALGIDTFILSFLMLYFTRF